MLFSKQLRRCGDPAASRWCSPLMKCMHIARCRTLCWLCALRTWFHHFSLLFFFWANHFSSEWHLSFSHFLPVCQTVRCKVSVTKCNDYITFTWKSNHDKKTFLLFSITGSLVMTNMIILSSAVCAVLFCSWLRILLIGGGLRENPLIWCWFAHHESPIEAHSHQIPVIICKYKEA